MSRIGEVSRKTKETEILARIDLDGRGHAETDTGIPFLDHMFDLLAKHGQFDISVRCKGDLEIDAHHTIEDIGIAFGEALLQAMGDKAGINRYGWSYLPMDETLVRVVLDLSNRFYLVYHVQPPAREVGGVNVRLFHEFFQAFAVNARINLHIELLYGEEIHHVIEAIFKALAKALAAAVTKNPRIEGVLSTKGAL